MRTFPFDQAKVQTLALLVTITRGIQTLRFTSHHEPITISGVTWSPAPGVKCTSLHFSGDGSPNTCDLNIASDVGGLVDVGDAALGGLDGWPITVDLVDPDSSTKANLISGIISHMTEDTNLLNVISVNGPLWVTQRPLTEHYSLTGRESLGDDRCKVPIRPADIARGASYVSAAGAIAGTAAYSTYGIIADMGGTVNGFSTQNMVDSVSGFSVSNPLVTVPAVGLMHVNDAYGRFRANRSSPDVDAVEDYANVYFECTTTGVTHATVAPTYPTTPGNTVTDGTAVFTARNSWLRYCRGYAEDIYTIKLNALPDSRASDATWYALGGIYVCSGSLSGLLLPIKSWDPATYRVSLWMPVIDGLTRLPADTQFEIYPGCDLTREMCFSRFNNILNLRAETFVPPANPVIGQSQGQGS